MTGGTTDSAYREYIFFAGQRVAQRDATTPTPNVYFYYTDQVGSTTAISTAAGVSCYQATFTPYGQEMATQTTCSTNYKFTGYERDAETGFDYAFARYYNSSLGRFMSPDPLAGDVSDPQTLNRYAYVENSPANFNDPTGMNKCVQPNGQSMPAACDGAGYDVETVADSSLMDNLIGFGWGGGGAITTMSVVPDATGQTVGGAISVTTDMTTWTSFTPFDDWDPNGGGGGGLPFSLVDLKTVLRTAIKKPDCAALFGGTALATQAINHLTALVNVDATGYTGTSKTKNLVDSSGGLATPVPLAGNITNGVWTGPNFTTYFGNDSLNLSLSQFATEEFHELIHATTNANIYDQGIVDLTNPFGQTMNIYTIHSKCGTQLPPKF